MCKSNSNHCHHHLVSDIRATRDGEIIFGKEHVRRVIDDEQTAAARESACKNPCFKTYMQLGNALAFQMRYNEAIECYEKAKELCPNNYSAIRKCAGRYLSVLKIQEAKEGFVWCVNNGSDLLDAKYMLGCALYYEGDFIGAKNLFDECLILSETDGDMYVASLFWAVACLVRMGENVDSEMKKYDDDIKIGHHTGYKQSLKLFRGEKFEICDNIEEEDELQKCIFYYGAHLYYLANSNHVLADKYLEKTLSLDTYFSAFAYLGAYTEHLATVGAVSHAKGQNQNAVFFSVRV